VSRTGKLTEFRYHRVVAAPSHAVCANAAKPDHPRLCVTSDLAPRDLLWRQRESPLRAAICRGSAGWLVLRTLRLPQGLEPTAGRRRGLRAAAALDHAGNRRDPQPVRDPEKPVHASPGSQAIWNFLAGQMWWGGWGSNPRPADYEKYGPALRVRYLHGYHGVVPPTALSALVAQMGGRSTNRPPAASPDPLILLLCVTSLAAPVPMSGACGPARNITNRRVSARLHLPDGRVNGAAS
jgi:hypothetical protein